MNTLPELQAVVAEIQQLRERLRACGVVGKHLGEDVVFRSSVLDLFERSAGRLEATLSRLESAKGEVQGLSEGEREALESVESFIAACESQPAGTGMLARKVKTICEFVRRVAPSERACPKCGATSLMDASEVCTPLDNCPGHGQFLKRQRPSQEWYRARIMETMDCEPEVSGAALSAKESKP
jgi:hypothetical protein